MKTMTKRVISIFSALALTASVTYVTLRHTDSLGASAPTSATTESTTLETTLPSTTAPTTQESTAPESTTLAELVAKAKQAVAKTTTKAASTKKTTTGKPTTKLATQKVAKYQEKPSEILPGKVAVSSWNASSGSMSVKIEKIRLHLPVYENGKKTSKTATRYGYFAIVKGPASGLQSISAMQCSGKKLDTITGYMKRINGTFAVNGEMCSHKEEEFYGFFNAATDQATGTVIKNGRPAQVGEPSPSLTISKDGEWQYPVTVSAENVDALAASGIITTIGYTYPMIWDGEPWYIEGGAAIAPMWNEHNLALSNKENHFYNDHTVVGQIDPQTHVIIVGESFGRGYLCEIMMNEMGVQKAYWANGGHCSVMYLKGYGVLNRPTDPYLCGAADILYF